MGTDVYLEWDGKSEVDRLQGVWGSIGAGNAGYLRASIGMRYENSVLRVLFPDGYWTGGSSAEYDFKVNFVRLNTVGLKYLMGVVKGEPLVLGDVSQEVLDRHEVATAAMVKAITRAVPEGELIAGGFPGFREAVIWLDSLFSFFELGIEKQEKGLKPYPYISW
jgi:hypothetical protein